MNYVIIMEQVLNGKKWAVYERLPEKTAIEWIDKPIEFINDVPNPLSPGVELLWTYYLRDIVQDMDREMLRGSGAVMPDRTWRCEEDLWPYEGYGSEARKKWSY